MDHKTLTSLLSLPFFLLALLTGCDRSTGEEELAKMTKNLKNLVKGVTPNTDVAEQEVEKLFTLEYRVLSFASTIDASELQTSLAQAGAERWDCFHVESRENELLVICKRQPKTYLRYIPRVF